MGYLDMKWFFGACRQQRQQLSLLAAGVLPDSERAAALAHLEACAGCQRYYEEMRTLSGSLSAWSQTTPNIQPTPAWRARWTRSVDRENPSQPRQACLRLRPTQPRSADFQSALEFGHSVAGIFWGNSSLL